MLRVEATKRWDRGEALCCDGAVSVSLSVCDEDDGVTPVMNQRRWLRRRRWKMTTAMKDDDGSKDLDLYCGLFEDQQK